MAEVPTLFPVMLPVAELTAITAGLDDSHTGFNETEPLGETSLAVTVLP